MRELWPEPGPGEGARGQEMANRPIQENRQDLVTDGMLRGVGEVNTNGFGVWTIGHIMLLPGVSARNSELS